MKRQWMVLVAAAMFLAVGCDDTGSDDDGITGASGTTETATSEPDAEPEPSEGDDGEAAEPEEGGDDSGEEAEPEPEPEPEPTGPVGRCDYTNPFSQSDECKEYRGLAWTTDTAQADCDLGVLGAPATFVSGEACAFESFLGACLVGDPATDLTATISAGSDPADCGGTQTGCELFSGGTFEPSALCEAEVPGEGGGGEGGGGFGAVPFVQPFIECVEPVAGEPSGAEGGQVCTMQGIGGCTEPGRLYGDYGDCEVVLTQRPYYAYEQPFSFDDNDPRLADEEYMTEMGWVTEQVEACGCVCCHSNLAPQGPSGWAVDSGPLWLDGVNDSGLAMLAGLVDSTSLGAVPAEDNNGFDRLVTGLPTTDIDRMEAFLVNEYLARGNEVDDADGIDPFGGPVYSQLIYEPSECGDGQGTDESGALIWTGGDARYVYVLEADAASPGVPPNLDEPDGTLWFFEVSHTQDPMSSGVMYGALPPSASQRLPESGAPAALNAGESYYLYVLRDIGFPLTRCLFTAP